MDIFLIAMLCLVGGGTLALVLNSRPAWSTGAGVAATVAGSMAGLWPAVRVLGGAAVESRRFGWPVPGGEFHVQLDPLSAFFLVPVFLLAMLAAVYGGAYMQAYRGRKPLGPHWFFFNVFVAGMGLMLVSRQALLFMMAWEVMSLAAFFLVTFEHEKKEVRIAGWIYLVATHVGGLFLLAFFLALGRHAGSLDFDQFMAAGRAAPLAPVAAGTVFLLALIGFGTKAGLVPLHIWLPEAHPAAPSHVSALMSGVMIKMGVYGLLRTLMFLGGPAAWWGPLLAALGLAGALTGIALALFQRDMKRTLAYSSIENVGLIMLALGLGLWGLTAGHPLVATLGLAGALLHIWSHALMKGLMFLGAGSVLHSTGTRDMERLGGLMQRMPVTGTAMTVGALAIAAVPPLNGFVSEWLIYMAMLKGGLEFTGPAQIALLLAVGVLALVGGLSLICFVRLIGTVLLGDARTADARAAHESSGWMTVPLGILAGLCALAAVFPHRLVLAFSRTVETVFGLPAGPFVDALADAPVPLAHLGLLNLTIWAVLLVFFLIMLFLQRRRPDAADATWGCGYAAPTPRMQYTGLSFSEMMVRRLFPAFLRPRLRLDPPQGVLPAPGKMEATYSDVLNRSLYQPFFAWLTGRFSRLRWVQQGKLHYYMMYFVVILLAGFAWLFLRRWLGWM